MLNLQKDSRITEVEDGKKCAHHHPGYLLFLKNDIPPDFVKK
jgi:hypothetical protein